jgi:GH43 family beta-xylosidase
MGSYINPVYPFYFADPFVWKFEGVYYAVGTGPVIPKIHAGESEMTSYRTHGEELAFPILRSADLVNWSSLGGALHVPDWARGAAFWAPEVAVQSGKFFLYYSVATEGLHHQLRVASSSRPEGPYEDLGLLMPDAHHCPFAIDAHPFCDDDGQWYLFYARDFLDTDGGVRVGTALVVDRLLDMVRLEGNPRVVLRARHDWQRFQANREMAMYGGTFDWHTLEGPCVRKQAGRYFCLYSGGCYLNDTYGVDYGIADAVLGPYSDAGNASGPRVMKTVPNRVLGPGHLSVVVGPDNRTEYFVYHAWDLDMTSRRMCIDRFVWTKEGPRCEGPTWTEQFMPES